MNLETSYLKLPEIFFSKESPSPAPQAAPVVINEALAATLGFPTANDFSFPFEATLRESVPFGVSPPLCLAYAGHQFGNFTMLGDGRAHLICERLGTNGIRYDVQLKGSGQTVFSRRGDGRATLGPMLREYLMSEAMHALGIPTTRSLAVYTTGANVWRDALLPGALLVRVAQSHLRVGTFEYAAAFGTQADVKKLTDYAIERHFAALQTDKNPALAFLQRVADRQIELLAQWMLVGFIHGVMNTDNMAISGETIDYGPCAFMNSYNLQTVFSSIDRTGRYAYGAQPSIAFWNLARFAETLFPLISPSRDRAIALATEVLDGCPSAFERRLFDGFGKKLGFVGEREGDRELIQHFLRWMERKRVDFTRTFRQMGTHTGLSEPASSDAEFTAWHNRWRDRLNCQPGGFQESLRLMSQVNPVVVPRNHHVEAALTAAVHEKDLGPFHRLLEVVRTPFNPAHETLPYAEPPSPEWENGYKTFCGT